MIKKYLKNIKRLFKTNSLVILKCDRCESVNLKLIKDSIWTNDSKVGNTEYNTIEYYVVCKDCNYKGYVREIWR